MNVFNATLPQEQPEQKINDVCELFSQTLRSLAKDAEAVRQLTSLAKLSGVVVVGENDRENASPNVVFSSNTTTNNNEKEEEEGSSSSLKGLYDLNKLVTGIEQKVVALRLIVSEEKRALEKFEGAVQQEVYDQVAAIDELRKACDEVCVGQPPKPTPPNPSRVPLRSRRDSVDPRTKEYSTKTAFSNNSTDDDNNNDNIHDSSDSTSRNSASRSTKWSFKRITARELQGISRNTLRRISITDLNEALEEIERACQSKEVTLPAAAASKGLTSNSLQRRYEYLKQKRASVELEVEAHVGHVWVSEQELREHCAFFRHGESTARATLSILCYLKRLKQTPGRNSEITYICLTEQEEEDTLAPKLAELLAGQTPTGANKSSRTTTMTTTTYDQLW